MYQKFEIILVKEKISPMFTATKYFEMEAISKPDFVVPSLASVTLDEGAAVVLAS